MRLPGFVADRCIGKGAPYGAAPPQRPEGVVYPLTHRAPVIIPTCQWLEYCFPFGPCYPLLVCSR